MRQTTNHPSAPWILAAADAEQLRRRASELRRRTDATPDAGLAALAPALVAEADRLPHRAVILGGSRAEIERGLDALAAGERDNGVVSGKARNPARVAFVFPPLRAEFEGMALDLLDASTVFREQMRACEAALEPFAEWSVEDVLRGRPGTPDIHRLDVSQHALFATCISLARLWEAFGAPPQAVTGYSLGEIPAVAISGSLTLEEAARLTHTWGRSSVSFENRGKLAAVALPAAELEERIAPWRGRLWISAFSSPGMTSVSGEEEAVDELLAVLGADGIGGRSVAPAPGHSPAMREIHEWFAADLPSLSPRPGTIPFYSSAIGRRADQAGFDARYWSSNLSQPVHFEPAVRALLADGYDVLIEVGPRPVLAETLGETIAAAGADAIVVGTLDQADPGHLLRALAQLFVNGVEINWDTVCGTEPLIPVDFWPAERRPGGDGAALTALLAGVPAIEREATVLDLIRTEVASAAGVESASAVDPDRPFKDLGFDSPKAVGLRDRLIQVTSLNLSVTIAFDHPTPRAVARKLLLELDGNETPVAVEPAGPGPDVEAIEAIDELDLDSLLELGRRQRDELGEPS